MLKRAINFIPADGWMAYCWVEEADKYAQLPLLAWAVTKETNGAQVSTIVVGLIAGGDNYNKENKIAPVIFADELINFRFYRPRSE